MARCAGLLGFEQVAGLLVRSQSGYRFRCLSCDRAGSRLQQPKPGVKCLAPIREVPARRKRCAR